jgi:two-component system cell cycle sensor histidine kinase/response regulator CckA
MTPSLVGLGLKGPPSIDYFQAMDSIRAVAEVLLVAPEPPAPDGLAQTLKDLMPGCEVTVVEPFQLMSLELSRFGVACVDGRGSASWIPETTRTLRLRAAGLPIVLVVRPEYGLEVEAIDWGSDECAVSGGDELGLAITKAQQRRREVNRGAHRVREENERVRQLRLRRHNEALRALARQLASNDLQTGLRAITEAAAKSLEVTRVSVWLFESDGTHLTTADVFDPRFAEPASAITITARQHPEYFKVLQEERVIAVDDVRDHPALTGFVSDYFSPLGIVSVLDAPVRVGDQVLGVVCHEQVGTPRQWTDEDHALAGSFADFVALAWESHEHRKAEEALRSSNAQLDDARRIEAVGRLAGGVAHDFNNVITVVSSYAFLLARKLDKNDPLQGPVAEIGKAAERAADITRKLLALSRRDPVAPRVLDLNVVLRGMETFLRRLIGEHIQLELSLAKEPLLIRADPGQIEQVVLNLVVNARDAAAPEGGNIALRTLRDGGARKQGSGRFCVLEVSDNGVGMPKDVQDRIFEPFFTTKDVGKGSGLGLFTVWGTVAQMGGTIEVKSAPRKGSRFQLKFAEASPETGPVASPAERGELMGNETVLLVEDEAQVREVTALILKDLGYRVLEAENIDQAIAHATGAPHIDLLVSDIVMPRASGPVVAARLRELIPSLRVLFISGYSKDMLSAYDASLGPTLPKPFTVEQIGKKVREVLNREPTRKQRAGL